MLSINKTNNKHTKRVFRVLWFVMNFSSTDNVFDELRSYRTCFSAGFSAESLCKFISFYFFLSDTCLQNLSSLETRCESGKRDKNTREKHKFLCVSDGSKKSFCWEIVKNFCWEKSKTSRPTFNDEAMKLSKGFNLASAQNLPENFLEIIFKWNIVIAVLIEKKSWQ